MSHLAAVGQSLIAALEAHLMNVVHLAPECEPGGKGLSNRQLQDRAGLDLQVSGMFNSLNWVLAEHLCSQGRLEKVGQRNRARYRLPAASE